MQKIPRQDCTCGQMWTPIGPCAASHPDDLLVFTRLRFQRLDLSRIIPINTIEYSNLVDVLATNVRDSEFPKVLCHAHVSFISSSNALPS
jgi:hypothetical protein